MIKPKYQSYSQTTVRVENSQAELTRELAKYGIYMVQHTQTDNVFSLAFQVEIEEVDRPITVRVDVPYQRKNDEEDKFGFREQRRKYRVLFFYVKGLLVAWDGGLKAFMDIFMAHMVLPGGRTISQDLLPKYQMAIESGELPEVRLITGGEEK